MPLRPVILSFIEREFTPQEQARVVAWVDSAGPRCRRSAPVGSRGALEGLESLIADPKKDYRDVIVAGKYEVREKKLVRVKNLNQPFDG